MLCKASHVSPPSSPPSSPKAGNSGAASNRRCVLRQTSARALATGAAGGGMAAAEPSPARAARCSTTTGSALPSPPAPRPPPLHPIFSIILRSLSLSLPISSLFLRESAPEYAARMSAPVCARTNSGHDVRQNSTAAFVGLGGGAGVAAFAATVAMS